jgi:3-oxoacyl-[acyl-carrier-protein] synthase-1
MNRPMEPLVVSRFTLVNSLGAGVDAVAAALRAKRSGLVACNFETARIDTCIGPVEGLDAFRIREDLREYDCRNNRLVQWCLEQDGFASHVAAASERYGAGRIGLFLGTSTSGLHSTELAYRSRDARTGALPSDYHYAQTQSTYSIGAFARRYLGLNGPGFVVSSACSSTAKVFGNAARMIAAGVCDAAVVGGADTLCLMTLYGFQSLGLTSPNPCRPFDAERDGISIGEGAGFVLLEKSDCVQPGAELLLGVGESSDAYHMSTPHPEGLGARIAMEQAVASASLTPGDIDYVNLHGTATRSNDASEDRAVVDVFGTATPCSSTKGATGHLLGAAGVTEAIISLLAIRMGLMPGSANTRLVDPSLRSKYLLENTTAKISRVLSNSFGFGGSNCSLVLGKAT